MRFDADDTAKAAAALGMPLNFEDAGKAAGELIEVIEKEKRDSRHPRIGLSVLY